MKLQTLIFLMLFSILLTSYQKFNTQGVIIMTYTGDPSKPFPVLLFHLPGTINTTYDSTNVYKFEISEEGFSEIRSSLFADINVTYDSILNNPYLITIIKSGESSFFSTCHLKRINKIFETISSRCVKFSDKNKVSKILKSVLSMLRSESKRRQ